MGAAIILCFFGLALIIWALVKLTVWIIKTAVKEALREYESEKHYGPQ